MRFRRLAIQQMHMIALNFQQKKKKFFLKLFKLLYSSQQKQK